MTTTIEIQETKVFWDKTADELYVWDRTSKAWELFFVAADLVPASGGTMTGALQLPNIGINTTPDATNKLALKSSAALFDNVGAGVQVKVNKKAAADTGSFLFQTDYSGRAEIGLCGDDSFHFKVSADGSSWTDAIVINKSNGQATFAAAPVFSAIKNTGTLTLPTTTDTLVGRATVDTLSSKTFSGATNFPGNTVINASGNIGIGTQTPSRALTLAPASDSAFCALCRPSTSFGAAFLYYTGGQTNLDWQVGMSPAAGAAGDFYIYGVTVGGAALLIQKATHNVGIKTDNPAADFHVNGSGLFAGIGINTASDSTNKLAVSSAAVLFNHAGAGVQLKMNKNAAANTVSTLYQTGFSGRAEVGLCGDDSFHFKVSPNGSSWTDALQLDKTTGYATFGSGIAFLPGSAKDPWTNGQVLFEATNDTTVKVKLKGSDGTVRAIALTLA